MPFLSLTSAKESTGPHSFFNHQQTPEEMDDASDVSTQIIMKNRGLALDRVHNPRRPLDRLQCAFATLTITLTLIFVLLPQNHTIYTLSQDHSLYLDGTFY